MVPPPSLPPKWPAGLQSLLEDCWAEEPNSRPAMAVVASRLSSILEDRSTLNTLEAWHMHRCAALRKRKARRGIVSVARCDDSSRSCAIC